MNIDALVQELFDKADAQLLASAISIPEGQFLRSLIQKHDIQNTIEIGCANGISSLFICDALRTKSSPHHVMIDPYQTTQHAGKGIANLKRANISFAELIEKPSEIALPQLLDQGRRFEFGFIDGYHTFDHALLDFFYLNRLVTVGGLIALDDNNIPSVNKAARYIAKYSCYRLVGTVKGRGIKRRFLNSVKLVIGAGLFPFTKLAGNALSHEFLDDSLVRPKSIRDLDDSTMVAFQKVAEDERSHFWYEYF